jgi:hypothetical protein
MEPNPCRTCHYEQTTGEIVDKSKSALAWAKIIGIGATSVKRHFKNHLTDEYGEKTNLPKDFEGVNGYSWNVAETDFAGTSRPTEEELTANDVEKFILSKGLDPKEWDYTWRFSEWEQNSKIKGLTTLHAFKVTGRRKKKEARELIDPKEFQDILGSFVYKPKKIDTLTSLVLVATDFQLGKTDWNGGHKETIEQVLQSFHKAAEFAKKEKVDEIVVVDAGDIIENIYNTSSQLATNSLSLPAQISQAFKLVLTGLKILSEVTTVRYVAVTSNHGAHRLGPKQMAGNVHDDWGIALADMIRDSTEIEVITPDPFHESLIFETSGSHIGVVHGHQAGGPDKVGDWWKGQSHGNMPTAQARILISGHWHSFRMYQSGDARWVFVGPASDRGSSWFTNARGEWSESGMLAFLTRDNLWADPKIL